MRARPLLLLVALIACRKSESTSTTGSPPPPSSASKRVTLECLSIEQPPDTEEGRGKLAPVVFHGKRVVAQGVTYPPVFSALVDDTAVEDEEAFRDDLRFTFDKQYEETKRLASTADGFKVASFEPPTATSARAGGMPAHRWQVDAIATFEGKQVPWRSVAISTVFRKRGYVITVAAAREHIDLFLPAAERYFSSIKFDACK